MGDYTSTEQAATALAKGSIGRVRAAVGGVMVDARNGYGGDARGPWEGDAKALGGEVTWSDVTIQLPLSSRVPCLS